MGYALFGRVTEREMARAERTGSAPRLLLIYGVVEAGIGIWVVSPLRYSGLFECYEQWAELSAESTAFLVDLRDRIEALPPEGGSLRASGLPERKLRGSGVGVHGAAGLAVYSVRAWADLELPERRVRVVAGEPAARKAGDPAARKAGEIVVVVERASSR